MSLNSSQNDAIQAFLEAGNSLTPLDALRLFGCLRLSARIYELKAKGLNIVSIHTAVDERGKKYVSTYRLIATNPANN